MSLSAVNKVSYLIIIVIVFTYFSQVDYVSFIIKNASIIRDCRISKVFEVEELHLCHYRTIYLVYPRRSKSPCCRSVKTYITTFEFSRRFVTKYDYALVDPVSNSAQIGSLKMCSKSGTKISYASLDSILIFGLGSRSDDPNTAAKLRRNAMPGRRTGERQI